MHWEFLRLYIFRNILVLIILLLFIIFRGVLKEKIIN